MRCTCGIMRMTQVKLVVSGSWESALLKVTWPDDLPPDETLVSDNKQIWMRIVGGSRIHRNLCRIDVVCALIHQPFLVCVSI